ncbi:hypothetical protein B0O80DRAFT_497110 [Mortierella sp. GBAus27b]|nr:hypothetical protein B0O80DRAFT_497110 [Mortierella sp. GBAus27b]
MSLTKESKEAASGTPATSRTSTPNPVSDTSTRETGSTPKNKDVRKGANSHPEPLPASSPSIGASIRIVVLLALTLVVVQHLISEDPSQSPLNGIIQFFQPVLDTVSSTWSSLSDSDGHQQYPGSRGGSGGTDRRKRSTPSSPAFGVPLSDLYSESSPLYQLRMQQEAQRERAAQRQSRKEEKQRQRRSNSPFEDFFGTGGNDDDDDDDDNEDGEGYSQDGPDFVNSEACGGYYCRETDVCVHQPIQCPCPYPQDSKCIRGDWYVCYRGPHSC